MNTPDPSMSNAPTNAQPTSADYEKSRLQGLISQAPSPLLPPVSWRQNPLFVILMILAFLASLSLFALFSSLQARQHWQANLSQTASIHIKPKTTPSPALGDSSQSNNIASQQNSLHQDLETAQSILSTYSQIDYVERVSNEKTRDLLRAWLGDAQLPADLPIPQILHVQLKSGQALPIESLQQDFTQASIHADIDNHQHWAKALDSKVRAMQLILVLIFIMVFGAILAAISFAIQAALAHREKLINVLHQIGAPPHFTVRLFSKKFAFTGFQAGCIGSAGAFIIVSLLSFIFTRSNPNLEGSDISLLPNITSPFVHYYVFLFVPIVMAVFAAIIASRHIKRALFAKMYS